MFMFPMAGLSSRFKDAGYTLPKYQLDVGGKTLFEAVISGFSAYFCEYQFVFIYRSESVSTDLLHAWLRRADLRRSNYSLIALDSPTQGQAHTVALALDRLGSHCSESENLTIFNIDTIYRDFVMPEGAGLNFIDVTTMPGSHWSFVLPKQGRGNLVEKVTEKERISNLCSVGLYGFESAEMFREAYKNTYHKLNSQQLSEQYIAPIYQTVIDLGVPVHYRQLESSRFDFIGTPDEYEYYMRLQNKHSS